MESRPGTVQRGRGAIGNPTGRFEDRGVIPFDDGWLDGEDTAPRLPTVVLPEDTRRILSSNTSPDVPFSRSVNPYKGCEHGCVYCFARPTHAYLGLSPGLDFETRIFSKPRAAELLRKELRRRSYQPEVLALGANTDPYQPAEQDLGITREILEVLDELGHPVGIITKSARILRDLDLLEKMAERNLVQVHLSITTLDPGLARRMEPRASSPGRRLAALARLSEAGVPTSVLASPMIPGLNDPELEAILEASAEAGALSAGYILLRLPMEVADLFVAWLEHHYPDRKDKILELLRASRGGQLYRSEFGERMRGTGPHAELLAQRFELATRRLGLNRRDLALSFEHFAPRPGSGSQLSLF